MGANFQILWKDPSDPKGEFNGWTDEQRINGQRTDNGFNPILV